MHGVNTWLNLIGQCLSEFILAGQVSLIPRSKVSFWNPTISSISDIKRSRHYRRFQKKVYIKIISFFALKRTQLILFGHYSHKPNRAYCFKSVSFCLDFLKYYFYKATSSFRSVLWYVFAFLWLLISINKKYFLKVKSSWMLNLDQLFSTKKPRVCLS